MRTLQARAAGRVRTDLGDRGAGGARPGHGARDEGSAIVEFLGVALVLLVPVVYLVLVLGRLQSASFAVDGAAREAVRAVVTADDAESAALRATTSVELALGDQGLSADPAKALAVACDAACLTPGTTVTVQVAVDVALPGVPGWLADVVPLSVPVTSSATAVVDTYVEGG
jgi:hypothetical protein